MNVLILCEESQSECKAFRAKGHNAFSLDILPCSGDCPGYHIKSDVYDFFSQPGFITENGDRHLMYYWDLIVAHPPCTYITKVGSPLLFDKEHNIIDDDRYCKMIEAVKLFYYIYNLPYEHIAIENPMPLKIAGLPLWQQVVQPYQFGEPYTKFTCLWLKNVPFLYPTKYVVPKGSFVAMRGNGYYRSKSFHGISEAMAEQWTRAALDVCLNGIYDFAYSIC